MFDLNMLDFYRISPSRNAPSPDIIFGVISSNSAARKRAGKSSSGIDDIVFIISYEIITILLCTIR